MTNNTELKTIVEVLDNSHLLNICNLLTAQLTFECQEILLDTELLT